MSPASFQCCELLEDALVIGAVTDALLQMTGASLDTFGSDIGGGITEDMASACAMGA
jgi:hypothetical protein